MAALTVDRLLFGGKKLDKLEERLFSYSLDNGNTVICTALKAKLYANWHLLDSHFRQPTDDTGPAKIEEVKEKLSPEEIKLRKEAKAKRKAVCDKHLASALPTKFKNGVFECAIEAEVPLFPGCIILTEQEDTTEAQNEDTPFFVASRWTRVFKIDKPKGFKGKSMTFL